MITCSCHYDILGETRSRMTTAITFTRHNDTGSRVSNTQYWENVVLVVVLISESKGLYWKRKGFNSGWRAWLKKCLLLSFLISVSMFQTSLFVIVSRNGLFYRVQFTETIAFCPRCCRRKQTEQAMHDRLIFGVTNL